MEKKYQVFVSSTYKDLIEERKKVYEVLLSADCIPAGMEAFVATNEEQFNVIKQVIDLCDYYILIIGKRYGSINEKTGQSYTEMEYDYARSKKIPVLVFPIDESVDLPSEKTESEETKKLLLQRFQKRALSDHLAGFWKTKDELASLVGLSIMKAKQKTERPGWIRGGSQFDLAEKLNNLQAENEQLRLELQQCANNETTEQTQLDHEMSQIIPLLFSTHSSYGTIIQRTIEMPLSRIFVTCATVIDGTTTFKDFRDSFSAFCPGYLVAHKDAIDLIRSFESIGLIRITKPNQGAILYSLTLIGKDYLKALQRRASTQ